MSELTKSLYIAIESHRLTETLAITEANPELLTRQIAGLTIIHHAAGCNFEVLIPKLVELGCSANALDENGYPPIYFPCSEGYTSVVRILLDCGADVDGLRPKTESGYIDQTTPLTRAVRNGHLDVVDLLLNSGACTDVRDPESLLERAKRYPEVLDRLRIAMDT